MRQQAAAGGPPQSSLPNGPSAEPLPHHPAHQPPGSARSSPGRGPCAAQPTANGSCPSSSPLRGPPGHSDKGHASGPGGGTGAVAASNGNVPYLQQNSLPHNCTAASQPSTSSTTSSPSLADEAWRSQQRNNSTQVSSHFFNLSPF